MEYMTDDLLLKNINKLGINNDNFHDELEILTNRVINNNIVVISESFEDIYVYYCYLMMLLLKVVTNSNNEIKDKIISRIHSENVMVEDIFSALNEIIGVNRNRGGVNEIIYLMLSEIVKTCDISVVRENENVQELLYTLTPEQRHLTVGYDLWEILDERFDINNVNNINNISNVNNSEKDKRCKLALLLSKKGLLNSKVTEESINLYRRDQNFNIHHTEIIKNRNIIMPNIIMPNIIMPNIIMPNIIMPNIMYLYLYELDLLSQDNFNNSHLTSLLEYEFFRYLDTSEKDYVLKFILIYLYLNPIIGKYYTRLYKDKKIDINFLRNIIENRKDNNECLIYNVAALENTLLDILHDKVINNDNSDTDVFHKYIEITTYNRRRTYIINDYMNIIANHGNKEWIKWVILQYKCFACGGFIVDKLSKRNYKYIIEALDEDNYPRENYLVNGGWVMDEMIIERMTLFSEGLDFDMLVERYNGGEGNFPFKQWMKKMLDEQV